LVREFKSSGLTQRKFSENRGIALSELQRSLKIVRRASEPQLMAVQIEADEPANRALELMVGEGYRIKIGAGFCSTTLRRLLEVLDGAGIAMVRDFVALYLNRRQSFIALNSWTGSLSTGF
jgi:hypothetical protein